MKLSIEDIEFREDRVDLIDKDGNLYERDVLHVTGHIEHDGQVYVQTHVMPRGTELNAQLRQLTRSLIADELAALIPA